MSGELIQNRNV